MFGQFSNHANFLTIYIQEAHPQDEWQVKDNDQGDHPVCYLQPKTLDARIGIAEDFVSKFDYPIPLVIDGMNNKANELYSAWPERLYILDERGKIAYKGGVGPFFYIPREVRQWLEKRFGT